MKGDMNFLSIQSHVAYGHVGNSAAVFALQRLGHEVWPIHTVQFSNHPGHGGFTGRVEDEHLVRDLIDGLAARGIFADCDGVITGYLGDAALGAAALDAVARVKSANPAARYCCDPVLGDVGDGVYVRPGVAEFIREQALPAADVATPNHFELDWLAGRPSTTLADILAAVEAVRARGPRAVLVTSARTDATPNDAVDLVACGNGERVRLRTPKLPLDINGAGDAIAALFFAHYLATGSVAPALAQAASAVFGIVSRTAGEGARELLLIAAQDEIVKPSRLFRPEPV